VIAHQISPTVIIPGKNRLKRKKIEGKLISKSLPKSSLNRILIGLKATCQILAHLNRAKIGKNQFRAVTL